MQQTCALTCINVHFHLNMHLKQDIPNKSSKLPSVAADVQSLLCACGHGMRHPVMSMCSILLSSEPGHILLTSEQQTEINNSYFLELHISRTDYTTSQVQVS